MARGHKYSKAQKKAVKEKFLEALQRSGGIYKSACEALHISRRMIIDWRREDPEFDEACNETVEVFIDEVETKLHEAIKAGNFKAIKFFLERKARNRGYDMHQDIDLTTTVLRPRVIFEDDEDGVQDQ